MRILFISLFAFVFTTMSAQRVKSSSYDILLQGLLSHSVKEIGVDEVEAISGAQLLDAREKEEYNVSHIKGSTFVGYKNFDASTLSHLDKSKPVIVYCSVGYRSEKIAEKLEKKGFTEVYNLYGGIFEWVNQDKPIYNKGGQTRNIHPYSWLWGQWLSKGNKTTN